MGPGLQQIVQRDTVSRAESPVLDRISLLDLRNFTIVDSTEWLRDRPEYYHFKGDLHWNARGHERVARGLFESVSSLFPVEGFRVQTAPGSMLRR